MKPSQQVDATDRLQLETALALLREKTGAEVAIAIVTHSCWDNTIPWRVASTLAAIMLVSAPLSSSLHNPELLSVLTLAAFAVGFGFGQLPRLQRNLQSAQAVCSKINARAQRTFSELGLAQATQKRGILFFVSLLEEQVVVLADEGVRLRDSHPSPWPRISEIVATGFRDNQPVAALLTALEECTSLLAPVALNSIATRNQNISVLIIDD